MTHEIVLVSETPAIHDDLIRSIEEAGTKVSPKSTLYEALPLLENREPSAVTVIFDCCSPDRYPLRLLAELRLRLPQVQQLIFYPHPVTDTVGEAFARHPGIHLYPVALADPGSYDVISNALGEVLVKTAALPRDLPDGAPVSQAYENDRHAAPTTEGEPPPLYKGSTLYSEAFLRRVASADVPVLLHGETGVGKEVMAKQLWRYSARAGKPFLKLNCAALPSELIESELFGYEKGAFTGATIDKIGKFEMAQNGTILLDEIGDMDVRLQAKLLQVLQDGEVQPLGSSRIVNVNVRVMAATHRDLRRAIAQGSFREDLYYRLNVISITIPPLRERLSEVLPLAGKLLLRHLPEGMPAPVISKTLERAMLAYRWPGNVRELENVMRRFLVYQDAGMLARELSDPAPFQEQAAALAGPDPIAPVSAGPHGSVIDHLAQASREAEVKLLLEALESTRWNRRQAAIRLNVDYKAFLYKLQKHGLVESKAKRNGVSA